MRKLNIKNKIFILIFSIIILLIIGAITYAIKESTNKEIDVIDVNNNLVVFAQDTNQINTNDGGVITKNWDGNYYYKNNLNNNYNLGYNTIVYNTLNESVTILGDSYQVLSDGSTIKNSDKLVLDSSSITSFYKIADREYLIVSRTISNDDNSIYATKFLIVNIDKQGNASVYNDTLNIKTINPMVLKFDDYSFDIANEVLRINNNEINLKLIFGSTNEYVKIEIEQPTINYDEKKLVESYNNLVEDFTKYSTNNNLSLFANNFVTYNNYIINSTNNNNNALDYLSNNKTGLVKRVSLRSAVAHATFTDVSYIVVDPENKYQAVYLLVTGEFNNVTSTQKILLDKYDNKYRILDMSPNSEYTISLGYIEVSGSSDNPALFDYIEDVINIRTTKINYELKIDKISNKQVFYSFKMFNEYAFSSCDINFYIDNVKVDSKTLTYIDYLSNLGYQGTFELNNGRIYEIRIENAYYNEKSINTYMSKKFTVST